MLILDRPIHARIASFDLPISKTPQPAEFLSPLRILEIRAVISFILVIAFLGNFVFTRTRVYIILFTAPFLSLSCDLTWMFVAVPVAHWISFIVSQVISYIGFFILYTALLILLFQWTTSMRDWMPNRVIGFAGRGQRLCHIGNVLALLAAVGATGARPFLTQRFALDAIEYVAVTIWGLLSIRIAVLPLVLLREVRHGQGDWLHRKQRQAIRLTIVALLTCPRLVSIVIDDEYWSYSPLYWVGQVCTLLILCILVWPKGLQSYDVEPEWQKLSGNSPTRHQSQRRRSKFPI